VFNGIGGVSGQESYRGEQVGDVVVWMGKLLPDVHRDLHRVNVLGDVVAIELSIRGTFLGPFETPTGVIQPTGPSSTSRPPTSGTCATARSRSSTAMSVRPPCSRRWAYCRTSRPQSWRPCLNGNGNDKCAAAQQARISDRITEGAGVQMPTHARPSGPRCQFVGVGAQSGRRAARPLDQLPAQQRGRRRKEDL